MPDALVKTESISKRFGGVRALSDVDLVVRRGTVHALVGENGAGKSTLGKVVAGAVEPTEGTLVVDGRPVHYRSPVDALRDGITLIAQELALLPHRSVLDNVFLGSESSGEGRRRFVIDRRRLATRYAALVDDVGLDVPPSVAAGTLRIADQQKVEILRALAREARLIVMDEPTAALGHADTEQLLELVRRLAERGTTIVFVSHFLAEVLRVADEITVLRDGRVVKTAEAEEETAESLIAAMLGRTLGTAFPEKIPPPPSAPTLLAVRGLSRDKAIRDVSLEVRAGEIVGLAGLVGSGRSDVARAIFGADPNAKGTVEVGGRPIRIRSPRDAIRAGIAMLPESRKTQGLQMNRPVRENVTLAHLRSVSVVGAIQPVTERRRVLDVMARVDVRGPGLAAPARTLSGGNQQKLLFARWLFEEPRVMIADEPTRGVDIGAKLAIYTLLAGLAKRGMGILMISSEIEEILGLSHRILVMRSGRVVAELDGATATEDTVLSAAFGRHLEDAS